MIRQNQRTSGPLGCVPTERVYPRLDERCNTGGYLVLDIEDVLDRAIEVVGPQMFTGNPTHQLRIDAQVAPRLADAPLEHIAGAKVASYLADIDRPAFVGEGGIAGDDGKGSEAAECGYDVVDTMPSAK